MLELPRFRRRVLGRLWEGDADGDLHVPHDHASGFGMLQKPGDKVPFIEIGLQKGLAGLLPDLGLLTRVVPFFSRDSGRDFLQANVPIGSIPSGPMGAAGWDYVESLASASGSASQRWDYTASGSSSSDYHNHTSNASSYSRGTSQWMRQIHLGSDTTWSEQYTITQSGSAVSITGQSSLTRNAWGDASGSSQASGVSGQWVRMQTASMSGTSFPDGTMSGTSFPDGTMSGSMSGSMSGTASGSSGSTSFTSGTTSGDGWYGTESTWNMTSNSQDHYRRETSWTATHGTGSSGWGSASMTNTSTHVWGSWQGSSNHTTTTTNYGGTSTSSSGWPGSGSYDQWQWNEGFGTEIWIGGYGGYGGYGSYGSYGWPGTTGLSPRIGSIPSGPMGAAGWGYVENSGSASGYLASGPSGSGSMSGTTSGSGASTQNIGYGGSGSSSAEAAAAGAAGAGMPGAVSPPPPLVDDRPFWQRVQDNFYDLVSDGAATKSWELDQRRKAAGIPIANDRPGVIPGAATFAAIQRYSDAVSARTRDWVTTLSVYAGAIQEGLSDGAVIATNELSRLPFNIFGYQGPLELEAKQLVDQNGGLYAWSQLSSRTGSMILHGVAGGVVLQTAVIPAASYVSTFLPCWAVLSAKITILGGVVGLTGWGIYSSVGSIIGGIQELKEGNKNDGWLKIADGTINLSLLGLGAYGFKSKSLSWETIKGWFRSCFTGETPILVEGGSKRIDEIRPGDRVLSRSEHDPASPTMYQQVEEVFVRTSSIIELTVSGRTIRTTREHPFWVVGAGWKPISEMTVGDQLLGLEQESVLVEKIVDTDQWETVYNFRVAEFHTYFVGGDEWGFSVWAHNTCYEIRQLADGRFGLFERATGNAVTLEGRAITANSPDGVRLLATDAAKIARSNISRSTVVGTLKRDAGGYVLNEQIVGGVAKNYEGHHLISLHLAENSGAMLRAAELGYNINRGSNGIALPSTLAESQASGLPYHGGKHLSVRHAGSADSFVKLKLDALDARVRAGTISDQELLSEIGLIEDATRVALRTNRLRLQSTDPHWKP
ncbi:polymorphic toxin-type HINT domain-containing protein [Tuwongella immobilis]|uniref:polymorphic toxin-type HINT domain-containing protein n=1 Tax=Tuwongella immobilis TaxID=692036 RepID=UPI0013A7044F|nr:polymorphic toxin-type HINT domain-containing protein [Tuwongella immobilis]